MSAVPVIAAATRYRLSSPTTTVWRAPGLLQVALDGDAFLITGCPREARALIASLRRPSTAAEIRARYPTVDEGWVGHLLDELKRHGRLGSCEEVGAAFEVGVIGTGRLAHDLVRLLLGAGPVWVADTAPRDRPLDAARRREGWRALAQGREHHVRVADHWHGAVTRPAAVIVLCPDTIEVDRVQTDQLLRHGRPHVVVTAEAERSVVGPFVVPGMTPCLRCRDVQRRREQPDWAGFVAQLSGTRSPADPLLRQWAAATAAAQVRTYVDGGLPDAVGGTLELSARRGVLEAAAWLRDPECGCGGPW